MTLYIDAFTDGMAASSLLLELHFKRGLRLTWYTKARREMRRSMQKSVMASVLKRMILNPHWIRSSISFLQKAIDLGDRLEEWVPLPMACRMVSRDHYGTTSTGKPLAAYSSSRAVVGWPAAWGGAATVSCCANLM